MRAQRSIGYPRTCVYAYSLLRSSKRSPGRDVSDHRQWFAPSTGEAGPTRICLGLTPHWNHAGQGNQARLPAHTAPDTNAANHRARQKAEEGGERVAPAAAAAAVMAFAAVGEAAAGGSGGQAGDKRQRGAAGDKRGTSGSGSGDRDNSRSSSSAPLPLLVVFPHGRFPLPLLVVFPPRSLPPLAASPLGRLPPVPAFPSWSPPSPLSWPSVVSPQPSCTTIAVPNRNGARRGVCGCVGCRCAMVCVPTCYAKRHKSSSGLCVMAWSANRLQVKWPVALFPPTPCGTESEGLSHALEATRLPQRAEGPSEVGEGRAGVAKLRGALHFSGQRPPQRSTIIRGRGCQSASVV